MPAIEALAVDSVPGTRRRPTTVVLRVAAIAGTALLVLNLVGLFVPLRAPEIGPGYADFARPTTLTYDETLERLDSLDDTDRVAFLTEVTRTFHYAMAHIEPDLIDRNGYDHYRMRVPAWENFVLWGLSIVKPDTYADYEFCSHRKALERGTGRCGQQSLALMDFLSRRGIDTGYLKLGGHTVAMAAAAPGQWLLLDADYGGVIPLPVSEVERNPASVIPYYWNSAIVDRDMYRLFAPEENVVTYGGPEARWARVCPIERASYVAKWAIPLALVAPWLALAAWRGRASRPRAA